MSVFGCICIIVQRWTPWLWNSTIPRPLPPRLAGAGRPQNQVRAHRGRGSNGCEVLLVPQPACGRSGSGKFLCPRPQHSSRRRDGISLANRHVRSERPSLSCEHQRSIYRRTCCGVNAKHLRPRQHAVPSSVENSHLAEPSRCARSPRCRGRRRRLCL